MAPPCFAVTLAVLNGKSNAVAPRLALSLLLRSSAGRRGRRGEREREKERKKERKKERGNEREISEEE